MEAAKTPTPKRHHYVPEFLQKRFLDETGRIHFYNKDFPERGTIGTTPRNLFIERELYTRFTNDGARDTDVEIAFSPLESSANKLIERFVAAVRAGNAPHLNSTEKAEWDAFFFLQIKRVPEFHSQYQVDFGFEAELQRIIAEYEQKVRPLTDEERTDLECPETIERLKRNTKITALQFPGELVRNALAQKGLAFAHITLPNKSFILGSSPIAKFNFPDRTNLSDPSVEVWFPIASDVAVSPSPEQFQVRRIEIKDPNHVRYINLGIAKQSKIIAARSAELVTSLASPR